MSFAAVRAVIESKVWDQFQAMNPAVQWCLTTFKKRHRLFLM